MDRNYCFYDVLVLRSERAMIFWEIDVSSQSSNWYINWEKGERTGNIGRINSLHFNEIAKALSKKDVVVNAIQGMH